MEVEEEGEEVEVVVEEEEKEMEVEVEEVGGVGHGRGGGGLSSCSTVVCLRCSAGRCVSGSVVMEIHREGVCIGLPLSPSDSLRLPPSPSGLPGLPGLRLQGLWPPGFWLQTRGGVATFYLKRTEGKRRDRRRTSPTCKERVENMWRTC